MKARLLALALLGMMAAPGCRYVILDGTRASVPMHYGRPAEAVESKGRFRRELTAHHLVWGIFGLGAPEVSAVVAEEVARLGGRGAFQVRYYHQKTFLDSFLAGITWQIYMPTHVVVEGFVY